MRKFQFILLGKEVKNGSRNPQESSPPQVPWLCSDSSLATRMRASSTKALSSHVYHSSNSWRKLAVPVDSDTFRVASLQSRSTKPGMLRRAAAEKRKEEISKQRAALELSTNNLLLTCMAGMIFNLIAASQSELNYL